MKMNFFLLAKTNK